MRWIALIPPLLTLACGGEQAPTGQDETQKPVHDHSPKHGGIVLTLGNHEGHVEVKREGGKVTIWVTDPKRDPLRLEAEPVLNYLGEEGPVQLTGEEVEGNWVFTLKAGKVEKTRFRLKLAGKTYTPKWEDPGGPMPQFGDKILKIDGLEGYVEVKLNHMNGTLIIWPLMPDGEEALEFDEAPIAMVDGKKFEGEEMIGQWEFPGVGETSQVEFKFVKGGKTFKATWSHKH